jgi:hypothetical protein
MAMSGSSNDQLSAGRALAGARAWWVRRRSLGLILTMEPSSWASSGRFASPCGGRASTRSRRAVLERSTSRVRAIWPGHTDRHQIAKWVIPGTRPRLKQRRQIGGSRKDQRSPGTIARTDGKRYMEGPAGGNHQRLRGLCEAGATGLEPATSGVTGRRSNQLSYAPQGGVQYDKPPARTSGRTREHPLDLRNFAGRPGFEQAQAILYGGRPTRPWAFLLTIGDGDLRKRVPVVL